MTCTKHPRLRILLTAIAALCLSLPLSSAAEMRFFAVGDLPYSQSEEEPLSRLLAEASATGTPFLVHVGDIKGGSAPCTDANLDAIAGLFRGQGVPVVYTPGDNEWTDCHRPKAGGLDPLQRLGRIREAFFSDPAVLRTAALGAETPEPAYPESGYFLREGVLFVVLHVVGSNNGWSPERPEVNAERSRRDAANRRILEQALAQRGADARALVLIFHANPLFESEPGPTGFRDFKTLLRESLGRFTGPVLALHGDTHKFRHDRPWADHAGPESRLVRVEVPGSPLVGGVWIGVSPEAPEPFRVEPVYAVSLEELGAR